VKLLHQFGVNSCHVFALTIFGIHPLQKRSSIFEMCTTTIPESINGPMVFAAELQITGNLVTDIALPQ